MSRYQRNRDLIAVGAYSKGNDAGIDEAIERFPWLEAYLQQDVNARVDYEQSVAELHAVLNHREN